MADEQNMKLKKIVFLQTGFKAILNSSGCQNVIYQKTKQICDEANSNNTRGGNGFNYRVIRGSTAKRWLGFVNVTDIESSIAETEDKALTRAVHE